MKEFIQLTYSFCFLACLLDGGHIIISIGFSLYIKIFQNSIKRSVPNNKRQQRRKADSQYCKQHRLITSPKFQHLNHIILRIHRKRYRNNGYPDCKQRYAHKQKTQIPQQKSSPRNEQRCQQRENHTAESNRNPTCIPDINHIA